MKYILTLIVGAVVCLGGMAQNRNSIGKTVESANRDLAEILKTLEDENARLDDKIREMETKIAKYSDRKYKRTPTTTLGSLEEYLAGFDTFEDMLNHHADIKITNYPESQLKSDYMLILEMQNSLRKPFDADSNSDFIDKASSITSVLEKHEGEFKKLTEHLNDYNFYMYELARLFEAAREDGYKTKAKDLVETEDAKYLMEVPYTRTMLDNFVRGRGELVNSDIEALKKSCPGAFSEFEF